MATVNAAKSFTANPTDTAERLARLADLLVEHGAESTAVRNYIQAHEDDREFAELAPLSIALKRALTVRSGDAQTARHETTDAGPTER